MFIRGSIADKKEDFDGVIDVLYDVSIIHKRIKDVGLSEYIKTSKIHNKAEIIELETKKLLGEIYE